MRAPDAQGRLWPQDGVAESTKRQVVDTAPPRPTGCDETAQLGAQSSRTASMALNTSSSTNVPRCDSDLALFELDRREFKISAVTASVRRCTRSRSGELHVHYSLQSKTSVEPKQLQQGFRNVQAQQTEAGEAWLTRPTLETAVLETELKQASFRPRMYP